MAKKYVYLFEEGRAGMRDLLGSKGANLAEISNIGLPVPPDKQKQGVRYDHELSPESLEGIIEDCKKTMFLHLDQLLHRRIDPAARVKVIARGLPASPGAASGKVVFDAER